MLFYYTEKEKVEEAKEELEEIVHFLKDPRKYNSFPSRRSSDRKSVV